MGRDVGESGQVCPQTRDVCLSIHRWEGGEERVRAEWGDVCVETNVGYLGLTHH